MVYQSKLTQLDVANLDKHFTDLLDMATTLPEIDSALHEIETALPEIQVNTLTQSLFPAGWFQFQAGRF